LIRLNALVCKPVLADDGQAGRNKQRRRDTDMLDAVMLALGLGFFTLCAGYTIACDRL
jgi:hypothetical protein